MQKCERCSSDQKRGVYECPECGADIQDENAKLRADLQNGAFDYQNLQTRLDGALLQNSAYRKALEEIKAKLVRSHDGGCILPLRDMVNDALGEGCAEKRFCDADGWPPKTNCGLPIPCKYHPKKCECGEPMHWGGKPGKDCGMPWPG